jgi:hypothetical protein
MGSMHCRLYDENLVHNIIMSAGLAVIDFLNQHQDADADDICEYLEMNADSIIEDTIEQLNSSEEYPEKNNGDEPWPLQPDNPDE